VFEPFGATAQGIAGRITASVSMFGTTVEFWTIASQGMAVPGPIVGAGLPGLVIACGGLLGLARRRRQKIV